MWWTSGCAPVAIEDRQTGVSDGKVEAARRYSPCSARKRSAGVVGALEHRRRETVDHDQHDGFRRRHSVPREGAQTGVRSGARRRTRSAEDRHGERLEVADHGNEGERRTDRAQRCRAAIDVPPRVPPRRNAPRRAAPSRARRTRRRRRRRPPARPTAEDEGERDRDHRADDEADAARAEDGPSRRGRAPARAPRRSRSVYQSPMHHECTIRWLRLQPGDHREGELRGPCAVDDAVVERDADVPHGAHDDLAVAHDRARRDAMNAEDPDLGMVDERRHEEAPRACRRSSP